MEYLDAFDKTGKKIKTAERKQLLNEIKGYSFEHGDCILAVPAVNLLLAHPEKGVYLVKRANKAENPYMWCKTVGGHISSGESPDETLVREAKEEINTEIVIANSIDDYFEKISKDPLTERAVVRKIDFNPWFGSYRLDRDTGKKWMKRSVLHIYAGRLRKPLDFTDATDAVNFSDGLGEATAYKIWNKAELQDLLAKGDPRFTHDLFILMRDYHAFI